MVGFPSLGVGMGNRHKNKAWLKFHLGRNTGTRGDPKKRILIVCEGEKTEPNYFEAFRVTSAVVKVIGLGQNTKRLVISAINLSTRLYQGLLTRKN